MIHLEISITSENDESRTYIITPEGNRPDGRVFLEIMRCGTQDEHDHWHGPTRVIDVDELFADEPA